MRIGRIKRRICVDDIARVYSQNVRKVPKLPKFTDYETETSNISDNFPQCKDFNNFVESSF